MKRRIMELAALTALAQPAAETSKTNKALSRGIILPGKQYQKRKKKLRAEKKARSINRK